MQGSIHLLGVWVEGPFQGQWKVISDRRVAVEVLAWEWLGGLQTTETSLSCLVIVTSRV